MIDRAIYANADARLLPLADRSVHMIACSPPYWGLRDYGTATWEGGNPECSHRVGNQVQDNKAPGAIQSGIRPGVDASTCKLCGAIRKDAQLGMEPLHDCGAWNRRSVIGYRSMPEFEEDGDGNMILVGEVPEPIYGPPEPPCGGCYVCNMRTWAREMWRVLADTGVMFLNLGDSYASNGGPEPAQTKWQVDGASATQNGGKSRRSGGGLKPKDLVGIPWRVALALQADGWYLRSDIIWAKPNPMPESVTDRPTKSHEYVFVLAKSARYFWDAEAVREPFAGVPYIGRDNGTNTNGDRKDNGRTIGMTTSARNLRTVWTIATAPYAGAHYATWPPALVERMIRAGTSERGVCPECGRPWERVVDKEGGLWEQRKANGEPLRMGLQGHGAIAGITPRLGSSVSTTAGWQPTCAHTADPIPAIVLDPFAGSGTTLMVARQLGRIGLGFDLSETYLRDNAAVRLGHDKLAAWGNGVKDTTDYADMPLFRSAAR